MYKSPYAWKIILTVLFTGSFQIILHAQTNPADLYQQTSEVNNIMVQYSADRGSLNRFYFIQNSPERREKFQQLITNYLQKMQELKFEQLNTGARVDYILFTRDLKEEIHSLELEEKEVNLLNKWFPFAEKIYAIERPRRRGTAPDAQKLAGQFQELYKEVIPLKKTAEADSSITIELNRRAQGIIKGLQDAVHSVYNFYNGYDPLFTWWVPEPY